MVCMNPTFYVFWAKAFFGLKCLGWGLHPDAGEGQPRVTVQFVWLLRGGYTQVWSPVDLRNEGPGSSGSLFNRLGSHILF